MNSTWAFEQEVREHKSSNRIVNLSLVAEKLLNLLDEIEENIAESVFDSVENCFIDCFKDIEEEAKEPHSDDEKRRRG